jgi:hypothetical protein
MKHFSEMHSMAFRTPIDFVALLFVMGSMAVLGLRRRCDLFQLSAIGLAMALGFRFPRDFWVLTLCCVAALADALGRPEQSEDSLLSADLWLGQVAAVIVGIILVLAVMGAPSDVKTLVAKSKANFPVAACDAIRSAPLPGPMFNSYEWGGFLAWYLPEQPVVIDSRLGLYGDERNEKFFSLMEGTTRVEEDPGFMRAKTLLLKTNSALTEALLNFPQLSTQFRVVYRDASAMVFVRR